MNSPAISVVMPVYNGEKYLAEAIDSILSQTFTDFEFIIVDDASTDGTKAILKEYAGRDPRMRLLANADNAGVSVSLNKGIRNARGKYIARMDADDISLPERFAKQVAYLERHQNVGAIGSWVQRFGERNDILQGSDDPTLLFFSFLTNYPLIPHPAAMIRRNVLLENNVFYDEELTAAQDFKLWHQLKYFTKLGNCQEVLLNYRVHANTISNKRKKRQADNARQVKKEEFRKNFKIEPSPQFLAIMEENFDTVSDRDMKDFFKAISSYKDRFYRWQTIKFYWRSKVKSKKDFIGLLKSFRIYFLYYLLAG